MTYDISNYDGTLLTSVADGSVDTLSSSLKLIGRNVQFYGDMQNENFVWLLQNFARGTEPDNPLLGQLWFDTTSDTIKVFSSGNDWRTLGPQASTTEPTGQQTGDLWFNTTTNQLFVYDGASYILVGPLGSAAWGLTEVRAELFTDSLAGTHKVLSQYVDGTRVSIISLDADFTAVSAADTLGNNVGTSGFTTVKRGVNLNTTLTNAVFNGDATNALKLGGVLASKFIRNDIDQTTDGIITIANDGGLVVDGTSTLSMYVDVSTEYGVLHNDSLGKGWIISGTNGSNNTVEMITFDPSLGSNGTITIPGNLIVSGTSESTTATKLATARTIGISGFITGSVSFDGSSNVTIVGTSAYTPVDEAGHTMTGTLKVPGNGFIVGDDTGTPQLIAISNNIGIRTSSPVTTLDVAGSIKSGYNVVVETSGAINIDAVYSTNNEINLTGPAVVSFTNFSTAGQILRLILTGTNNAVTWPVSVKWPNGVAPNLDPLGVSGNHIAVVTFLKTASYITATYVTY